MNLEKLKKEIRKRLGSVKFDDHFYLNFRKRPYLNEGLALVNLPKFDKYLGFQTEEVRGTTRYRIGIALSRKYTLVIVLEFQDEYLYIITAWKTDRKWQKTIQK